MTSVWKCKQGFSGNTFEFKSLHMAKKIFLIGKSLHLFYEGKIFCLKTWKSKWIFDFFCFKFFCSRNLCASIRWIFPSPFCACQMIKGVRQEPREWLWRQGNLAQKFLYCVKNIEFSYQEFWVAKINILW